MSLPALPKTLQIGKLNYTGQQLDLIRKTAAKDCDHVEFEQFIHVCGALQLDPMRKQIYAFVFSKDDPKKRQMSIIIGIGGYRSVASRSGNYRPDDKPPRFTIDENLIDPLCNPKGIVSCEVSVYLYAHGAWFPVPHKVDWDAYAPIIQAAESDDDYDWVDTGEVWPDTGKPKKRKKLRAGVQRVSRLDPNKPRWSTDPFGMLAKCAEAGSLRKAFPDDFSGVYDEAEMDRAHSIELSASEYAESAAVEKRLELIGGAGAILFDFCDERGLHPVPLSKLHDECEKFLRANAEYPDAVDIWRDRNTHQLKEFWARAKADALDVREKMDAILKKERVPAEREVDALRKQYMAAT